MARFRTTRVTKLHSTIGDMALAWRTGNSSSHSTRYGFSFAVSHLLAASRTEVAAAFTVDFEAQMARRRATGIDDVDRWVKDCGAVAQRAQSDDTDCWAHFARAIRRLFQKPGWEPWRVLFQAAMDHADDSHVTIGAEAYEATGKRDWTWLRWLDRPLSWRDACDCVVVTGSVFADRPIGAVINEAANHIICWTSSRLYAFSNPNRGEQPIIFGTEDESLLWATELPDGRPLSWHKDGNIRVWNFDSRCVDTTIATGLSGWTGIFPIQPVTVAQTICLFWHDRRVVTLGLDTLETTALVSSHVGDVAGALAFDSLLLCWSRDGELIAWNLTMPTDPARVIRCRTPPSDVVKIDSNRFATRCEDDEFIGIWDIRTLTETDTIGPFTHCVRGIRFLDSNRMVWWSNDSIVRITRLHDRTERRLTSPGGVVQQALVLNAGILVSWDDHNVLTVWNWANGTPSHIIDTPATRRIHEVVDLGDSRVAIRSERPEVSLFDCSTGAAIGMLRGHTSTVSKVLALKAGFLLTLSFDATARVWRMPAGTDERDAGTDVQERMVHILHNGCVATWNDGVAPRIWQTQRTECARLELLSSTAINLVERVDAALVTWSENQPMVKVWHPTSFTLAHELTLKQSVVDVVSMNEDQMVTAAGAELKVWDAKTGRMLFALEGHNDRVRGITSALGGTLLLSWSNDLTVRVWSATTGKQLVQLRTKHAPDGAVLTDDGWLVYWSRETCHAFGLATESIVTYPTNGRTIFRVTLAAQGSVVIGYTDGGVLIWDTSTGERLAYDPLSDLLQSSIDEAGALAFTSLCDPRRQENPTQCDELEAHRELLLKKQREGHGLSAMELRALFSAPVIEAAAAPDAVEMMSDGVTLCFSTSSVVLTKNLENGAFALLWRPASWVELPSADLRGDISRARAAQHSLFHAIRVLETRGDLVVFDAGNRFRLCRFIYPADSN